MLPRNDKSKVGDRVRIIRGTSFDSQNDGIGTLRESSYPHLPSEKWWTVDWDNGEFNGYCYPEEDLERVTT